MSDVGQVIAQMVDHDMPQLPVGHPKLDGKYHRFGKGNRAWYILREMELNSGRTVVTGAFGFFQGENRNTVPVTVDMEAMSAEEKTEYARKQRVTEKAEADKRELEARQAAGRARDAWNKAANNPVEHPYLVRKLVDAIGLRVTTDGQLLIPMVRDGQIVGLQRIDQEGGKRYSSGMEKSGAAHVLGSLLGADIIAVGEGYATCASARMSVVGMIDLPVAVAFDAGAIMAIALRLRKAHPGAHLLFLADDDYQLTLRYVERLREEFNVSAPVPIDGTSHLVLAEDGTEVTVTAWWRTDPQGIRFIEADMRRGRLMRSYKYHNAGVTACHAAAAAVGNASVATPLFKDRGDLKLTDFNDLHAAEGLASVGAQIALSILAAKQPELGSPAPLAAAAAPEIFPPVPAPAAAVDPSAPPPPGAKQPPEGDDVPPDFDAHYAAAPPPEGPSSRLGEPDGAGEGGEDEAARKKDKPKKIYGQAHWDQVDYVLENFILIYGEDLVWDCRQRMLMKLSAMRTIVQNSDVMKFWGGPARKWVLKKNIVFDPSETPSPAESGPTATVNLFSGWKMTPKKGGCIQILTLLSHLCNGVEELETWIARWLAYPLRHAGAKMETSIIMHGDEGSGKNFFFEKVVKAIYGEYGYVIGNAQLESNFNDWASMKLFMVADEVVTRAELKQMKGKLKYLVSGDTVIVNPKGLPEHSEANQMNFVFLSNELQPLALDKTDRRYLVVWTPPALGRDFYVSVANEIAAGGIEAFYYYLVHELDMGDFNEHTKPIYNKAKDALIEKSLAPAERFYREWSRGLLPLPYVTCGINRLYAAFQIWCGRSGESKYTSLTMFSPAVERYAGGDLRKAAIKYDLGEEVKQRFVFCVGPPPEGKSLREWAEGASGVFESALKHYRSGEGGVVEG
jgi:putative DNA primase/helicase